MSYETLNQHSQAEIGYQIRFEKKKTDKTKVLFLTEGLLLRQISADPSLSGYDVIVLDEVLFFISLNSGMNILHKLKNLRSVRNSNY